MYFSAVPQPRSHDVLPRARPTMQRILLVITNYQYVHYLHNDSGMQNKYAQHLLTLLLCICCGGRGTAGCSASPQTAASSQTFHARSVQLGYYDCFLCISITYLHLPVECGSDQKGFTYAASGLCGV